MASTPPSRCPQPTATCATTSTGATSPSTLSASGPRHGYLPVAPSYASAWWDFLGIQRRIWWQPQAALLMGPKVTLLLSRALSESAPRSGVRRVVRTAHCSLSSEYSVLLQSHAPGLGMPGLKVIEPGSVGRWAYCFQAGVAPFAIFSVYLLWECTQFNILATACD